LLPGSSFSGSGEGGTTETGIWSWWDLYENLIGQSGDGINGWETYHYPEFGADILFSPEQK